METNDQNFWGVPDHASDTAIYYARKYQQAMAELQDLANLLMRPVTPRGDITYADLLPRPVMDVIHTIDEEFDGTLYGPYQQLVDNMCVTGVMP